jgi:hypothetical protein
MEKFPRLDSLRKGKEVSNIKYDDILRISGPLWLLTSLDSKTIKNDQNQISFYQRTLNDQYFFGE